MTKETNKDNKKVVTKNVTSDTVVPATGVVPTPVVDVDTTEETVKVISDIVPAETKKASKTKEFDKELDTLVEETLRGVHGSGRERMINLGTNYAKVQKELNRRNRENK